MTIEQAKYFIGVDGGGSNTTACLARYTANDSRLGQGELDAARPIDQLQVLSTGMSGPSNLNRIDWSTASANVASAIEQVMIDSSNPDETLSVDGICFAMSGAGTDHAKRIWRDWANERPWSPTIWVVNDGEPLFEYCHPDRDAVVVIAGTGSLVLTRTSAGFRGRCGGWGPKVGDPGSGTWIGYETLRKIVMEIDSKKDEGDFTQMVMARLGVADCSAFRQWLGDAEDLDSEAAALAYQVIQWANEGVTQATEIVDQAIWKLASLIQIACHRDGLHDFELVMAGGILANQEDIAQRLIRDLSESEMTPRRWIVAQEPEKAAAAIALRDSTNS